jgi:hypothetical protein
LFVDLFEATDEINDFSARVGSAGGGAEMGAAAEGAVFVDEAARGLRIEKRARTVVTHGELFSSRRFEGVRGEERFAAGQVGSFAG